MIIANRISLVDCSHCGERFFPDQPLAACPKCGAAPNAFPEAD